MGQFGGSAHQVRPRWLGVVRHGLSGRAAPQVSRRRYTDRERKTSDRFSSGPVEASRRVLRRLAPSPGSGNSRRPGQARAFRSRSWQRATKSASGCCERRGHSDQVGVWREASGSLGQRRVAGVWMAGIVPPFVRRAGLFGHRPSSRASGCSSSSPVSALRRQCAALAGASHVMALSVPPGLAIAHSRGRITPRWSRRRSAVGFLSGNRPPRLSASRYTDRENRTHLRRTSILGLAGVEVNGQVGSDS